jgi:hypothetical protein
MLLWYTGNMTEKQTEAKKVETRGRPKKPGGRKRFWWVGAHCSNAEKKEVQATAEREMPGQSFAAWVRSRLGMSNDKAP